MRSGPSAPAHFLAQRGITGQSRHCGSERIRVAVDDEPGAGGEHRVRKTDVLRHDHRAAGGHGFDDHVAEVF